MSEGAIQKLHANATRDIETLAREWRSAQRRLDGARADVNNAECDLANKATALGKALDPGDMKPGEQIAIWCRFDDYTEGLVTIRKPDPNEARHALVDGDYDVKVRGGLKRV